MAKFVQVACARCVVKDEEGNSALSERILAVDDEGRVWFLDEDLNVWFALPPHPTAHCLGGK